MGLYSVTKEKLALDVVLDAAGGEVADADIDRVLGLIDKNEVALQKAMVSVAEHNFALEAEEKAQRARAVAHTERARVIKGQIVRLKEWTRRCLDAMGYTKVKAEVYTVAIVGNGGVKPLKVWSSYTQKWESPEEVPVYRDAPAWAVKITKSWNTEAIRAWLEAQTPSPEEEADTIKWAHLEERGTSLRIGPKPKAEVVEASEEGVA